MFQNQMLSKSLWVWRGKFYKEHRDQFQNHLKLGSDNLRQILVNTFITFQVNYICETLIKIKMKSVLFKVFFSPNSSNIKINVTYSHQLSTVFLFGIISLRLTQERIENHLSMGNFLSFLHSKKRLKLEILLSTSRGWMPYCSPIALLS